MVNEQRNYGHISPTRLPNSSNSCGLELMDNTREVMTNETHNIHIFQSPAFLNKWRN